MITTAKDLISAMYVLNKPLVYIINPYVENNIKREIFLFDTTTEEFTVSEELFVEVGNKYLRTSPWFSDCCKNWMLNSLGLFEAKKLSALEILYNLKQLIGRVVSDEKDPIYNWIKEHNIFVKIKRCTEILEDDNIDLKSFDYDSNVLKNMDEEWINGLINTSWSFLKDDDKLIRTINFVRDHEAKYSKVDKKYYSSNENNSESVEMTKEFVDRLVKLGIFIYIRIGSNISVRVPDVAYNIIADL